jgi:hypothetical protein
MLKCLCHAHRLVTALMIRAQGSELSHTGNAISVQFALMVAVPVKNSTE